MTIMDLATRKYNFIKTITTIDEILLAKLEMVLLSDTNDGDWFASLSNDEKIELEIGLKEAQNNDFVSHDEVIQKFQKWH